MGFLKEFKDFALKGNVMDMAVGVIIGGAFGNIVTALTDSFITPLIQAITGNDEVEVGGQFVINGAAFTYGAFISAVINFLILALILFCVIKAINTASEKAAKLAARKKKEEEEAAPAEPSEEIKLLTEIRDALANK
ncbi:MAG: large conductance mechanosensitive channel protein MscL [Saccharofermentans sp.]|nr:large conductance mechanosensitive channel protein MscL [Saccharofermentans sp.]